MELFVFYRGDICRGRVRATVNKTELYYDDIIEIENSIREEMGDDKIIIENIIKLPIK